MTSITIRKLDESVKFCLRVRASRHGRSMEEEARAILKGALSEGTPDQPNLAEGIRRHIEPLGGAELALAPRQPVRRPPKLAE